ncbi:uncharacterized protein [Choristoneura fumiferana]|uniref:uncharacterized protein n=1 Tax=Choristoneura fumiferana TaxID=7141 RepID=UPI003D155FFB
MYSKIALFVALNLVAVFAQKACDCSDDQIEQSLKESTDITDFLNELAAKDIPEEEKYPVVPPNVITGMLACDCKENFRRKRRIIKEDVADRPIKATPRLSRRNCPKGYSRIGPICMPQHQLL